MKITKEQLMTIYEGSTQEIKKHIEFLYPELFTEKSCEVGKYYHYKGLYLEYVLRAESVDEVGIKGYGLIISEGRTEFRSDIELWGVTFTEITREVFLQQIMKYAKENLGFVEGVKYLSAWTGDEYVLDGNLECTDSGDDFIGDNVGCIFYNGKFATIVKSTANAKITPAEVWEPTMHLRFLSGKYDNETLQQKWVSNTGDYKWKEIKTV